MTIRLRGQTQVIRIIVQRARCTLQKGGQGDGPALFDLVFVEFRCRSDDVVYRRGDVFACGVGLRGRLLRVGGLLLFVLVRLLIEPLLDVLRLVSRTEQDVFIVLGKG